MSGITDIDSLRAGFQTPDPSAAPMTRWWWFGPSVKRDQLSAQLDTMRDAGYGGVEVSVVYPLSEETDRFMSETFLANMRYAAEEARDRGMRFDITLGSGWSFGGPHIDETTAARRIFWEQHEVTEGETRVPIRGSWPGDEFIAAYVGAGSSQETPVSFERLDADGEAFIIPQGNGPRVVLVAWSRLTGQFVKRAAAGAEGPVLDHYSQLATDAHIAYVCDPMLDAIPAELIGSAFCDSLEVYRADWTPTLIDDFIERRGYDPREQLWTLFITSDGSAQFRNDYYGTLSELYEENFVARLRDWAAGRGVPFRIQSYGEPPATVSSYRSADRIEGEGWGWKEITQTRWASSAASLYGEELVSAEVWTWVHSPSFRAVPIDLVGEVHEHLLLGINHFIGHGWPYHEPSDDGFGWIFYAAGALDERNPWWPAMPEVSRYIHRLSWLFRQGKRASDIAIYAPYPEVRALIDSRESDSMNLWAGTRAYVGTAIPGAIREGGYDFDVIDAEAMDVVDPARYGLVVVPGVQKAPAAVQAWLDRVEAAGGTVLNAPTSGEGFAEALSAVAPSPISYENSPGGSIGLLHRRVAGNDVFFVANTGDETVSFSGTLRTARQSVERWDAVTGRVVAAFDGCGTIEFVLQPYEAAVLVAFDGVAHAVPATPSLDRRVDLDTGWSVSFGDEAKPVTVPHRWEDDDALAAYSGSASYTTTVEVTGPVEGAVIDFGDVEPIDAGSGERVGNRGRAYRVGITSPIGVIAVVSVNGIEAGIAWRAPYEVQIGNLLRQGSNEIEVTIYNTAANSLVDDESVTASVALSRKKYGQRFRMQDLDAATHALSSGMLAVPSLRLPNE
ncbi:hypothetical protein GCM10010910_23900 [Microbacterium nanhaiense]|uniref:Glycoside hydrolase n=1 Tax=Microbacterium nanhaiense TaxID=1301026 RepID=A0ABQ2N298_9MICO|nr:glycosyl hydrolase [Microbacterium nanhaiense]GGO65843.1 hypothetical protein GCM10010910_23900 [Microbacterium nanhaiense]